MDSHQSGLSKKWFRCCAAGHSRGGKVSVLTALMDERVSALCLLDPVDNTKYAPLSVGFPSAVQALRQLGMQARLLLLASLSPMTHKSMTLLVWHQGHRAVRAALCSCFCAHRIWQLLHRPSCPANAVHQLKFQAPTCPVVPAVAGPAAAPVGAHGGHWRGAGRGLCAEGRQLPALL